MNGVLVLEPDDPLFGLGSEFSGFVQKTFFASPAVEVIEHVLDMGNPPPASPGLRMGNLRVMRTVGIGAASVLSAMTPSRGETDSTSKTEVK